MYRARQKSNPLGKFYISEIVADIFTKFAEFTDEDSIHITCKFIKITNMVQQIQQFKL